MRVQSLLLCCAVLCVIISLVDSDELVIVKRLDLSSRQKLGIVWQKLLQSSTEFIRLEN